MRALLDQDIILGWVSDGGIEVGPAPLGVGLERLRYDGNKVVDLASLSSMEVTNFNGVFILHAVPVPGSQTISMVYADRKNLLDEAGVYKIRSVEEATLVKNMEFKTILKNKLRQALRGTLGDTQDQIADLSKCLILVLTYLADGANAAEAKVIIDALAGQYADIYPPETVQSNLEANATALKSLLPSYYTEIIKTKI